MNEKDIEQLKRDLDDVVNNITEAAEDLKDYIEALVLALKTNMSYVDSFERIKTTQELHGFLECALFEKKETTIAAPLPPNEKKTETASAST